MKRFTYVSLILSVSYAIRDAAFISGNEETGRRSG
jgi:hypothetical protein